MCVCVCVCVCVLNKGTIQHSGNEGLKKELNTACENWV